jgi:hypothetical protein
MMGRRAATPRRPAAAQQLPGGREPRGQRAAHGDPVDVAAGQGEARRLAQPCAHPRDAPDVIAPGLRNGVRPARKRQRNRLAAQPQRALELRGESSGEHVVGLVDRLGPAHSAEQTLGELASLGRARGKQATHEQATEQGESLLARGEEAEALDRDGRLGGIETHRNAHDGGVDDARQRVGDLAVDAAQDVGRRVRGRRHHHAARTQRALSARTRHVDTPALAVARHPLHAAAEGRRLGESIRQMPGKRPEALLGGVGTAQSARPAFAEQRQQGAPGDRATALLELHQLAEDGVGAELMFVAGVDTGQEGPDQPRDHFGSQSPRHELRDRFALGRSAANEGLDQQAQLAARTEQRRPHKGQRRHRHLHHRAVAIDEAQPAGWARPEQLLFHVAAAQEGERIGTHHERIGPALDHVARDVIGAHHTARAIRRIDDGHLAASILQLQRRGQPRDTGPDDHRIDFGYVQCLALASTRSC